MLKWINSSLNKNSTIQTYRQKPFQDENIHGKMLDLEFQCESQHASKDLIAQLTSLYTQAVEYYEGNDDSRYRIYQKRMELFLKKPNIDDILRGKSSELVSKRDTAEKKITQARTKSKSEVGKVLERSEKLMHINKGMMESSLKQQQNNLKNRIERRKAWSNRSSNTKDDEDNEQGRVGNMTMKSNLILEDMYGRTGGKLKKVFI